MPKYEITISNKIYENRVIEADNEEHAWEVAEESINKCPHVVEEECEGPEIEEVQEVNE